MDTMYLSVMIYFLSMTTIVDAIQCYSGSQLQVIECPSINCIKQTLGFDTVSSLQHFSLTLFKVFRYLIYFKLQSNSDPKLSL